MSNKYPEYTKGEYIPNDKRICNVIVCKDCEKEWLLGQTNSDGSRADKGHRITLRLNPTLIVRT